MKHSRITLNITLLEITMPIASMTVFVCCYRQQSGTQMSKIFAIPPLVRSSKYSGLLMLSIDVTSALFSCDFFCILAHYSDHIIISFRYIASG